MRNDFVKFGTLLLVLAIAFFAIGIGHDFIARNETSFLVISALAAFGSAAYLIAGFVQTSPKLTAPIIAEPPKDPDREGPAKTGPGWHCSWCWAPLEKGSRYCTECGHKID